jgi:hypothetical protein
MRSLTARGATANIPLLNALKNSELDNDYRHPQPARRQPGLEGRDRPAQEPAAAPAVQTLRHGQGHPAAPCRSGTAPGRGAKRDRVTREVTLRAEVPAGSRFKGYKTVVRRDLVLAAEVVRYKRERWLTPEGQTIIAPLPVGIAGGYGPGVWRFCLALHTQGQVTTERLTDLLNGIGLSISKREVVRLLTSDLEMFEQEDHAVLEAGLVSSPYLTVDDTGARHAWICFG